MKNKSSIDTDVFEALIQRSPRLKALLEWRLALGELKDSDQVAQYFREDWNKIEEVFIRVKETTDE